MTLLYNDFRMIPSANLRSNKRSTSPFGLVLLYESNGEPLGFVRIDAYAALIFGAFELDDAIGQCKQRVIVADSAVDASVELGATLANDDRASFDDLTRESLDAQAFGIRISTVAG